MFPNSKMNANYYSSESFLYWHKYAWYICIPKHWLTKNIKTFELYPRNSLISNKSTTFFPERTEELFKSAFWINKNTIARQRMSYLQKGPGNSQEMGQADFTTQSGPSDHVIWNTLWPRSKPKRLGYPVVSKEAKSATKLNFLS